MKNLKQLFLLLFLSVATLQAQTRSEIQAQIETIATGVPNTALKIRTVLAVIADGTAQIGDVKEIDVSTAYIASNFDPTGLGINERLGWAICNGNNGTRDRSGRVPMQYSATYPTLGAIGGSPDAVVVEHSHTFLPNTNMNFGLGDGVSRARVSAETAGTGNLLSGSISTVGVSGANKNYQPYIITLFIMKLP